MGSPTLPARRGGGTERPFARCRRDAGLDLYRAATRLGCSAAYLRALELGHHALSQRLAFRMAREYGVRVNELFVSDDFLQPRQAGGTG